MNYTKHTEAFNSERWDFNATGVTFRNEDGTERQEIISRLHSGVEYSVRLERFEYKKSHAYHILVNGEVIGSVPANIAAEFAEKEDSGFWLCPVSFGIHGGPEADFDTEDLDDEDETPSYGVHILVKLISPEEQKAKNMSIGDDGVIHQERPDNPLDYIDGCSNLLLPAVKAILDENEASTAVLQRTLKIGCVQAAKLLDEMEAYNIVGPFSTSRSREIFVSREQLAGKIGACDAIDTVRDDVSLPVHTAENTTASEENHTAPAPRNEKVSRARRSADAAIRVRKIAIWIAIALAVAAILISKLIPLL